MSMRSQRSRRDTANGYPDALDRILERASAGSARTQKVHDNTFKAPVFSTFRLNLASARKTTASVVK